MVERQPDSGLTRAAGELCARSRAEMAKRIVGKDEIVRGILTGVIAGGHVLLEGVPGLAKTLAAKTFAEIAGLSFGRIQFTPDLLPADITGSLVYEQSTGRFAPRRGPVFANIVLADEVNRAPAKVQSALLEAMEEHQVTMGDASLSLPEPFFVLATQNPIEHEGTYPLPEAQLDRFLLQIDIGYPNKDAEKEMLLATTFGQEQTPQAVCTPQDLRDAQAVVRRIPVGDTVVESILRIVRAARPDADGLPELRNVVAWGPGPRASQAFMLACRARALIEGRLAPSTDDVVALAHPVLRHRMALNFAARAEGLTVTTVIDRLCRTLL